ncbi:DNA binding domain, partial [Sarracenia purpurea var. burkii]
DFGLGSCAATSSGNSNSMAGSGSAGPSAVRYGIDVDYQLPVTDLADAMFNLGSSSNNIMDLIFSYIEDKWELGDQKN